MYTVCVSVCMAACCVRMCCVWTTGITQLLRDVLPFLRKDPGCVGVDPDLVDEIVPSKSKAVQLEDAEFVSSYISAAAPACP